MESFEVLKSDKSYRPLVKYKQEQEKRQRERQLIESRSPKEKEQRANEIVRNFLARLENNR